MTSNDFDLLLKKNSTFLSTQQKATDSDQASSANTLSITALQKTGDIGTLVTNAIKSNQEVTAAITATATGAIQSGYVTDVTLRKLIQKDTTGNIVIGSGGGNGIKFGSGSTPIPITAGDIAAGNLTIGTLAAKGNLTAGTITSQGKLTASDIDITNGITGNSLQINTNAAISGTLTAGATTSTSLSTGPITAGTITATTIIAPTITDTVATMNSGNLSVTTATVTGTLAAGFVNITDCCFGGNAGDGGANHNPLQYVSYKEGHPAARADLTNT